MIKPYVMSLTQVKTYLSISDTSYDDQINIYLPIITDDLTRENGICNQDFLFTGSADTDGTAILTNVSLSSKEWDELYLGAIIYINGEDGEIESFDKEAETITLIDALTETETDQELLIRNFPTGSKPVAAQMILFKIKDGSVSGATFGSEVTSKSIGPVSTSFANGGNNMNEYGYPSSLTNQLKTIMRPRFH